MQIVTEEEIQIWLNEELEGIEKELEEIPENPEESVTLCSTVEKNYTSNITEDDLIDRNWEDSDPYYTLED